MTKRGLAESLGVAVNTINRYEKGVIIPVEENVTKISKALNYPFDFFYGDDVDEPRAENASFRGLASKTDKVVDAALSAGFSAYLLDDWFSKRYDFEEPNLLDLQNVEPDVAAAIIRDHWNLGTKPIKSMVTLLEANGVRVFYLSENTKQIDAFSLWRNDVPYVFLNRFKSAERSRFDASHELAHLCLHKHGGASSANTKASVEREADAFAGSFLMPEADFRAVCNQPLYSVDQLKKYKKRWLTSASAVNYAAHKYGLISKSKYQSNYVEMSRRGWLKNEPDPTPHEQSPTWQDILDDLYSQGITKTQIAREVSVAPEEIESLLFGLTNMISIDGAGNKTPKRKVDLRLVE